MAHTGDVQHERQRRFFRFLADALTLLRFAAAAFIVAIGLAIGPSAMPAAIVATIFGWLTDVLDGPAGRKSGCAGSAVSRADFMADCALGYSFFLFVVIAGLFPVWVAILLMAANLAVVILKPVKPVMMMVSAPYFALPVVLSFHAGGPALGLCYAAFLAALAFWCRDKLSLNALSAHTKASDSPHD